jgi:drug/metabolite transporter (DMT)-like permease
MMIGATPTLDGRSWALLVALALLWSVSFIFIKVAAAEIPILTLVLIRVALAALLLHGVVLASGRAYPRRPTELGRYGLMGLINNILPFGLIVYATPLIGAGAASILNATAPIFSLIVAHAATADEKITPAKFLGIVLGLGGVIALIGPAAFSGLAADSLPIAAMLTATFFYGVSAVLGRTFRGTDPIVSATCQLTASTLILAPVALLLDRPWLLPMPGTAAIAASVALAVFSTALAYVLFFALISRAGGTNTILVTLLIPVGGTGLAWLLLGEGVGWGELAGMFLIGFGLLVIDGRAFRRLLPPAPDVTPGSAR